MRHLTVTINPDQHDFLESAGRRAQAAMRTGEYQGETLVFDSPATFFSRLSERRWKLVNMLLGAGTVGVRELSRRLNRDVRRVHDDAAVLVELGLLEKDERGALRCPFDRIHIVMDMTPGKVA